jgi:undecaprenyl-diphosphatase
MQLLVNDYFVPTTLLLLVVSLWYEGIQEDQRQTNRWLVLRIVVAILLVNALVKLANLFYFRPRPFAATDVNLLFYRPSDSSFPSNPAAVGFVFAALTWREHRRLGWLMAGLALLFSLARVYSGVHDPSDVVAGLLFALVAAQLTRRIEQPLKPIYGGLLRIASQLRAT